MNSEEQKELSTKEKLKYGSCFYGSGWDYIGLCLLGALITIFTLGICFPWVYCMFYSWKAERTNIDGRRLKFNGTGSQLFEKWIIWWLLSIVTLGVYSWWVSVNLQKWITSHTYFEGENGPKDSYFDGKTLGFIGWSLLGSLIILIAAGICYSIVPSMMQGAGFVLGVLIIWFLAGCCYLVSYYLIVSWQTKHTVINGKRLYFNAKPILLCKNGMKWLLLSSVTLGIYAWRLPVEIERWKVMNTSGFESNSKLTIEERRAIIGYCFISPFIIGFLFFMIKPLFQSLYMSLCNVELTPQGFTMELNKFGWYVRALAIDPEFNRMLTETIAQMFYRSLATIVFSFFVAMLLNQEFKGRALVRSIFFLCVILSSGVLVGLEYNNSLLASLKTTIEEAGNSNSITNVLEQILVPSAGGIKSSAKIFKKVFEIIDGIYDVAMASGIQIIIFLSGLQNISPSMYEAAQMEGCTSWESLWKVTVPMVSPLMLVCWVYTIVDFFMKTDNRIMAKINDQMIVYLNYGYSSALAWVYFIVVMLFIGLSSLIISKVVYKNE